MIPFSADLAIGFLIGLALGVLGMIGVTGFALMRGTAWKEAALAQQKAIAAWQDPPPPPRTAQIIAFPEQHRGQ